MRSPGWCAAVRRRRALGTSFGAPTEREIEIAELICSALPSVAAGAHRVLGDRGDDECAPAGPRRRPAASASSSSTAATTATPTRCWSARAAASRRSAFRARPGCPRSSPSSPSQAPFNDLAAVETAFERCGEEIAACIVEPIAGNMGCVPPAPGFLEGLRELCDRARRAAHLRRGDDRVPRRPGAARSGSTRCGPISRCLGKVVGGGLPAAAYGGRRELMAQIAPEGPVYQAGTLSGNPLADGGGPRDPAAARAAGQLRAAGGALGGADPGPRRGAPRARGWSSPRRRSAACSASSSTRGRCDDFADAKKADAARFRRFFASMLDQGVYLAPSPFEAGFVSLAHGRREIRDTLQAAEIAFKLAARVH